MAIGETGNTTKKLNLSLVDGADSAAIDGIKKPGQPAVRERTPGEVREALLDRVDLWLAKYINEELSPERMISDPKHLKLFKYFISQCRTNAKR